MNAFRKQVFTGVWSLDESSQVRCLARSTVVDAQVWMENPLVVLPAEQIGVLAPPGKRIRTLVAGPGLEVYRPAMGTLEDSQVDIEIAAAEHSIPLAVSVASIAYGKFQAGQTQEAASLLPNYVRASAAEEQVRQSR